jgi:integrase
MKLSDARDRYLTYRQGNGIAEATVKNDRQAIRRLIDSAGDIQIERLGPGHLDTLISSMLKEGYAVGTVNITQSSLSAWFRWCRGRGLMGLTQDPIAGRRYVPAMPKDKLMIPLADFPRVLDSIQRPRDKALIAFGLFTMLRQSELVALRVRDLDWQAGKLSVRRFKTYSVDALPITPDGRVFFAEWITAYQEEVGALPRDAYLIPAQESDKFQTFRLRPDRPISRTNDIVRRVLERNGYWDERMGVHILRRSAARAAFDEMCKEGYDGALRVVAAWLGHKSVRTTEMYLGLTEDRAQRDKKFGDAPLYPSLAASNVIPLRKEA